MSHDPRDGPPPAEDAERDAWLREALRHAPDAAAGPPAALRESILTQARAATAPRSAVDDLGMSLSALGNAALERSRGCCRLDS